MNAKTILVATDFSTRSDRALRRATLLARQLGARLTLVHAIDDDQPRRLVMAERTAASAILKEFVRTLKKADGLDCEARIVEGDAFAGITHAAEELDADLVVIGPHRRQILRDVFVGTTAERTISATRRPILMANGVPAGPYRQALAATDLSPCSAGALRALRDLGMDRSMAVSVVHVFDAVGSSLLTRGAVSDDTIKDFLHEDEMRAGRDLDAFLTEAGLDPIPRMVRHNDSSSAHVIANAAQAISADLLVIGTHGRTHLARVLLGSVAQEVLRIASLDVLVVPPARAG